MQELAAAIDVLAAEDPATVPRAELAEQLLELHQQMARLQAQIARRSGIRPAEQGEPLSWSASVIP